MNELHKKISDADLDSRIKYELLIVADSGMEDLVDRLLRYTKTIDTLELPEECEECVLSQWELKLCKLNREGHISQRGSEKCKQYWAALQIRRARV